MLSISGTTLPDEVTDALLPFGPFELNQHDGRFRCLWFQEPDFRQLAACGLMTNLTGRVIELPIRSNFRE